MEFFCKNHNQLCCGLCITKIKGKQYGGHADCDVCFIENIKEEKKSKLKDNIKCLENLSKSFNESINKLKDVFEKINNDKEELKLRIQKIFTKLRNTINEREDKLLIEVDKQFDDNFIKDNIIKECEKLPNKIKISLEKGKNTDKEWTNDENKLNSLINDCLNIENNIKYINEINEKMIKCNSSNVIIVFNPEEEEVNEHVEKILNFGKVFSKKIDNFSFKKCPNEVNETRKYIISGENNSILTKTGTKGWMGSICDITLDKKEEYKWKIKILKSESRAIMVGVAPFDFDIRSSLYDYGWYLKCGSLNLYSGPPHNYAKRKYKKVDGIIKIDEITLIMNTKTKTLTFAFILGNQEKNKSYNDIPMNKPLVPAVLLYDNDDCVEIIALL